MTDFKKELNEIAKLLRVNPRTSFGYCTGQNTFTYNPNSHFLFSMTQKELIITYFNYILSKYSRYYEEKRTIKEIEDHLLELYFNITD